MSGQTDYIFVELPFHEITYFIRQDEILGFSVDSEDAGIVGIDTIHLGRVATTYSVDELIHAFRWLKS